MHIEEPNPEASQYDPMSPQLRRAIGADRQSQIVDLLSAQETGLTVSQIASFTKIAQEAVRKNLVFLERKGKVVRSKDTRPARWRSITLQKRNRTEAT